MEVKRYNYINLGYLHELAGGDIDFVVDMIKTFLDSAPGYMTEFLILKRNKNWVEMKRFAHKSKSSFMFMGLEGLSKDAAEIERLCGESNTEPRIEELLKKMQPVFVAVV